MTDPAGAVVQSDLVSFPAIETHFIQSGYVAQTFEIQVARPPRRQSDTAPLPVVYVTDGNLVFSMFREISRLLQAFGHHPFPPFLLVGIGYPSDSPYAGVFLRMRDYTASSHPKVDKAAARPRFPMEGVLLAKEGTPDHGGAEAFRRFISEELVPFIDERYETIQSHRTYVGHSGGGYFGLYTLFSEPRLFRNYIVSSPSLSYDGETSGGYRYDNYDFGFPMARDFIATGASLAGITLYMSVGLEEEFQPAYKGARLTSSFFRMAALLKDARIPGLTLLVEPIPGEAHLTVWPIAFMHGIQAVFGQRHIGGLY
jgi:predicted alpha/beta superfamily hydrolase